MDKLVEQGLAYPCFCSDEELELQREEAEAAKQPPIYRGRWAQASKEEVEEQMRAGTPPTATASACPRMRSEYHPGWFGVWLGRGCLA